MTEMGISPIESSVQKTREWVDQVRDLLELETREDAYSCLRGVLHSLRDRLTVDQASHLAAQMPMVLTGMFFENWKPSGMPDKIKEPGEFLNRVRSEMMDRKNIDPRRATWGVWKTMEKYIAQGELNKLKAGMPEHLSNFFDFDG